MHKINKKILDTIFFPLRCLFPNNENISWLGVTPLADDRFNIIEKKLKPNKNLLDIGCGDNRLAKKYRKNGGNATGIDIAPNQEADIEVQGSDNLDFKDEEFNYITIIASLNHIPTREKTIKEAYRCLKPGGTIFITNLSPIVGAVGHKIWHLFKSDLDMDHRGHMEEGEEFGLKNTYIKKLLEEKGFKNIKVIRFSFGLNNLIVATKS
ncbi:class I SAM-dependent methyltransferase [Candidatus Parcubacteria bacterium]|jgi:ubiquinone/menaquinone biosynthesis C-methylase UbiE|nr:class I SAM-dependent methyltransferase [Candidatus Parcubacteria bacterium]